MSDAPLPAGPKPGPRDTPFFEDPMVDHLLRALVTLAMEYSVTRDRLDALERLLEGTGALDRAALDHFQRDAESEAERAAARRRLIADLLDPLADCLSRSGP